MSYQDGLSRARQRRRRRSALVAGVVGLIVVGGFGYSVAYFTGAVPGSRPPAPPASCTYTPPPPPQAGFVLNVYNASGGKGEANDVANALATRNFQIGTISNDPYKETIDGVGQIRFGPEGKAYADTYVKPLVPHATLAQDGRTGTSVDVVIGAQFPTIKKAKPTPTKTIPGC